ncbi:MAG: AAA family ATPase [Sedimentisphaerales bacterium]|nr:AAA family ATPase [Sedimentisphaerales bacterium]
MIVVVTGMVGIDKKRYLQEVCALAGRRGKPVQLCSVGDMMYAEAPDIGPGRILDIPLQRLHSLRRSVMKDIITKAQQAEHTIVNTHATFRWRHGLFPAFDFWQMRQLRADLYICLIDSAEPLHVRLIREHSIRHSLKDLLVWREEEVLATELMQRGINENAGFYCLARGAETSTVETFYRLLFEPDRKKAYLSFPMTHVMHLPTVIAEIQRFREQMKKWFICFDPGDLEEAYLPCLAREAMKQGQDKIKLASLDQDIEFGIDEILQIETDINSQIYARDFALIDQADWILSYIPALEDGRAAISSGVERELQHAHEAGKDVYVIWTAPSDPSIFVTQTATKVFRSVTKAIDFFRSTGVIGMER